MYEYLKKLYWSGLTACSFSQSSAADTLNVVVSPILQTVRSNCTASCLYVQSFFTKYICSFLYISFNNFMMNKNCKYNIMNTVGLLSDIYWFKKTHARLNDCMNTEYHLLPSLGFGFCIRLRCQRCEMCSNCTSLHCSHINIWFEVCVCVPRRPINVHLNKLLVLKNVLQQYNSVLQKKKH